MKQVLVDTDTLSYFLRNHPVVAAHSYVYLQHLASLASASSLIMKY